MNYYEIYFKRTGELIAKGSAHDCKERLGCASIDCFYALANRAKRGINKSYTVVIKKGGETDYPVLGKNDPIHKYGEAVLSPVTYCEERKQ